MLAPSLPRARAARGSPASRCAAFVAVGPARRVPLPRQLLALPRLRAAARSGVRPGARARRDAVLRRERGARRPPPAGRRLPAARATPRTPRRRYPVLYLLHGVPGRPGAFLATVRAGRRRGRARRAAPRAADDPRDAVRLDGHRSPTRSGRTASATQRVGDVPRARRRARGRRALPDDPLRRARALAGLSEGGYGALNIGLHHPGEFRVLESWSGYERADDIGSIFGHRRRAAAREQPAA